MKKHVIVTHFTMKIIHTYLYITCNREFYLLKNFADDQVLLAQDHDDMEYMSRKLKEEYEKWGLAVNLEKN